MRPRLDESPAQGRVTPAEVNAFMADLLTTLPQFHPHEPLLPRAIAISVQLRHGVYDCLYVASPSRRAASWITADARLLKQPQSDVPVHHRSGVAAVIFRSITVAGSVFLCVAHPKSVLGLTLRSWLARTSV